jgi:hypothetical protein
MTLRPSPDGRVEKWAIYANVSHGLRVAQKRSPLSPSRLSPSSRRRISAGSKSRSRNTAAVRSSPGPRTTLRTSSTRRLTPGLPTIRRRSPCVFGTRSLAPRWINSPAKQEPERDEFVEGLRLERQLGETISTVKDSLIRANPEHGEAEWKAISPHLIPALQDEATPLRSSRTRSSPRTSDLRLQGINALAQLAGAAPSRQPPGLVDDQDILQNERVIDMDPVIAMLDPDTSQFMTMLMRVARGAESTKVRVARGRAVPAPLLRRLRWCDNGATSGCHRRGRRTSARATSSATPAPARRVASPRSRPTT